MLRGRKGKGGTGEMRYGLSLLREGGERGIKRSRIVRDRFYEAKEADEKLSAMLSVAQNRKQKINKREFSQKSDKIISEATSGSREEKTKDERVETAAVKKEVVEEVKEEIRELVGKYSSFRFRLVSGFLE